MLYVVIFIVGLLIGVILDFMFRRKSADPPVGDLVFDVSVSDQIPYLALKSTSDLDAIRNKRYVRLRVYSVNDSQK